MKDVTDFTKPDALRIAPTANSSTYPHRQGRDAPEGDRAKDDDIWNMVNYVRSLAKK